LIDILVAWPSLSAGHFLLEGSFEETRVAAGGFLNSRVVGTATPFADVNHPVRVGFRGNRALSLEWGRDISMPRQCGGFYEITDPDV
jgi:hypothetical protein